MAPSSSADSVINSSFTVKNWVAHVNGSLDQDLESVTEHSFSIFQVPGNLRSQNPEAYAPQLIAIGPLHHFKPELYPMQTFKLAAAKRAHSSLHLPSFPEFVRCLSTLLPAIRCSYDKHLEISDEALAWILAIDGLFLLDYLHNYGELRHSSRRHFLDSSERKVNGDSVVKDVLMLENQIPLSLLMEVETKYADSSISEPLTVLLFDFCCKLSPFDLHETYPDVGLIEPRHLLDVMYQLIWLKDKPLDERARMGRTTKAAIRIAEEFVADLWDEAKDANIGLIQSVAAPVDRVVRLSKALGISDRLRKAIGEDEEEVLLPTASQLRSVGLQFGCTRDGIRSLRYDTNLKMLWLPAFTWNPNCEVLIRNLVAYELMAKSENLIVNRWVQLMSCLVRSAADVMMLKEERIIVLPTDTEDGKIVELFAGMAGSGNPEDKTGFDDHVKGVNELYNSHRKIKMSKVVKKYLKVSWDVAKVMAAVLLLVMLGVQTFCDVYKCH
ncbi:unnamed protein product [Linum tenue]|uniref:Uncharacterized protein n=1 Tax=Linum tenue TaxID=586396 RepID=A0AAV0GU43_9ROSI|nr:unnamed protein product [Linum tenue]